MKKLGFIGNTTAMCSAVVMLPQILGPFSKCLDQSVCGDYFDMQVNLGIIK